MTRFGSGPVFRQIVRISLAAALGTVLGMATGCGGDGGDTATANTAPIADAGADRIIDEGALVQLDGSGSMDPDDDALTYQWKQTEGRAVTLSDPNALNPSFVAPGGMSADERLSFTLVVNDGDLSSTANAVTVTVRAAPPSAADGFLPIMTAALAKGRFTLNNPWTQADLDFENIPYHMAYDSFTGDLIRPYTTMMTEYEARRRQCEQDYNLLYAPTSYTDPLTNKTYKFQDRKCYPTLQWANDLDSQPLDGSLAGQVLRRYGYYCGGEFPEPAAFHTDAPEPLDAVDYCCRLHDAQTWADRGVRSFDCGAKNNYSNECGMAMCLRQATVKGMAALPPDVEEARQHWYGDGLFGGAAYACPCNQSNEARAPVGE